MQTWLFKNASPPVCRETKKKKVDTRGKTVVKKKLLDREKREIEAKSEKNNRDGTKKKTNSRRRKCRGKKLLLPTRDTRNYVVFVAQFRAKFSRAKRETQTDRQTRHCRLPSRASLVTSIAVGGAEAHTSPSHFPVPSLSNIS